MKRAPATRASPRAPPAAVSPPSRLRGPEGERYALRKGWTAQHGGWPLRGPGRSPAPAPRLTLEEGRVRVYEGAAPPARGAVEGPVYRTPGGDPAVPTGVVFVRFAEGVRAGGRRAELLAAGFAVESFPAWAPGAAWVRARSGRITDALRGLANLRRLREVEAVEPEVLTVRARR